MLGCRQGHTLDHLQVHRQGHEDLRCAQWNGWKEPCLVLGLHAEYTF